MFREYFAWLGEDGCFPDAKAELAALPGGYETILVARAPEMKRLYVRPSAQGSGTGRALVEASIARARELGYTAMRLDTLPRMEAARRLYLSLGFREIERYNDSAIAGVLFFELRL